MAAFTNTHTHTVGANFLKKLFCFSSYDNSHGKLGLSWQYEREKGLLMKMAILMPFNDMLCYTWWWWFVAPFITNWIFPLSLLLFSCY